MIWLNKVAGGNAWKIEEEYFTKCLTEFKGKLYAAVMGVAYGGSLEVIGELWKDRGIVYGFDTFEGHPKHLAVPDTREASCMDHWYLSDQYGTEGLGYEYQRERLPRNVILVKGEITKDSCKGIPKLHYVLLDMDILASTKTGFDAVKDKVVKGGYILFHDSVNPDNLPLLHGWFNGIVKKDDRFELVYEETSTDFAVLKRK